MKKQIQFGDMCWGSCQYDAAAEMYYELLKTEAETNRDAILNHFEQSLGVSLSAEVVYDKLMNEMKDTWDPATDDGDQEMYDGVLEAVAGNSEKTISSCFSLCRDMSWDLWAAAPYIAGLVFPNLDLTKILKTPEGETFGPTLNQLVQSYNGPTGFCCWLLKSFGFAEEPDFIDFDT